MAEYKTHNLGGVEVSIGAGLDADIKQWERNLRRAEQQLESFAQRMERLAGRLESVGKKMMLGITAPLTALAAASVKTAAEFQAFSNNFNQSFREMADVAREWSREFGDAVGRSRLQMETMMSMTQSMIYPMLENREAATQMSKAITQLAIDLGSFYDVADNEALDALRSALVGNTEPMRRFGVVVLDATLELEAQRIGLQKTVAEMTEAEKMMLRYVQILRQTADAHGDAIRNQDEFGNQLKALQADFENLRIELGEKLLPYATALLKWARDLMSALSELDDETVTTLVNFGVWAASAGVLVWTLSKVIKAVAGVSKGLQVLFRLMSSNPWLVLGAIAGGMLLTIDEVQDALESLARRAGLGDMLDAIEDVTGALEELMNIASDLEFDTTPDISAYVESLEEARKAAEDILRQGVADGFSEGISDVIEDIESGAHKRFQVNFLIDTLLSGDPYKWSLHQMRRAEYLSSVSRGAEEIRMEISMWQSIIEGLMEQAYELDIFSEIFNPQTEHRIAREIQKYMTWLQMARQELYEAHTKDIAEALAEAMGPGIEAAKAQAEAFGEPFDELEYRIEQTRKALQEQIALNLEIGIDWDANTDEIRAQLRTLLEQQVQKRLDGVLDSWRAAMDAGLKAARGLADAIGEPFDDLEYRIEQTRKALEERVRLNVELDLNWDAGIEDLRDAMAELQAESMRRAITAVVAQWQYAMDEGIAVSRGIAEAMGEPWDELQYKIEETRKALQERIQLNIELGFDWDEGIEKMRQELESLLRREQQRAEDAIKRQIMWETRVAPMFWDTMIGGATDRATTLGRKREWLAAMFERELEKKVLENEEFWLGEGELWSSTAALALQQDSMLRFYADSIRQIDQELAQIDLDAQLKEIDETLRRHLAGGTAYEVERFLTELAGDTFDGLEYQIQAVSRALWDQIDALQAAGKSWSDVESAIAPNVELLAQLSEEQIRKARQARIDAIESRLRQTLDAERWIQLEFARAAGEEFDVLQFEANALRDAMNQLASEMLSDGATVSEVLEATAWHMSRLAEVTELMARRSETTWLEEQYTSASERLRDFSETLIQAITPAGVMAATLEELAEPVDKLLSPIAILASGIATSLEPAFRALFPVVKGFGILILSVVQGVSVVWNAIVGTLGGIFNALANISIFGFKPLGFLQGVADFFNSLKVDTDELGDAMERLKKLTWDQGDAAEAAVQALQNVPSGFKVALRRFQVAEPASMPSAAALSAASTVTTMPASGDSATMQNAHSAGGHIIVINGDVYGWDDFRRKVAQATSEMTRSRSLSYYGTTAGV